MVSAYLADVDFPPDARVLEDRSGARGRDERGGAPARRGRLVLRPCRLRKPDRAKTPAGPEEVRPQLGGAGEGNRTLTASLGSSVCLPVDER
jgi:hypothetical protein